MIFVLRTNNNNIERGNTKRLSIHDVKAYPRLIILLTGLAISFTFAFIGLLCSHEILRPAE